MIITIIVAHNLLFMTITIIMRMTMIIILLTIMIIMMTIVIVIAHEAAAEQFGQGAYTEL